MDLQTISTVSKSFNISTRALRYYEQIGLLLSIKKDGYAYRTYDEETLKKLELIILLRKLRIQLKDIQVILQRKDAVAAILVFQEKISELSQEIASLSTIRDILKEFVTRLKENVELSFDARLLADESARVLTNPLIKSKTAFKEEAFMEDLSKADANLARLKDVRIVYLPPVKVASIQFYCDEPEYHASLAMDTFVRESGLLQIKPDLRHYGFNNPNCEDDTPADKPDHGYEMWVTIPDDFPVPPPLTVKHFAGGLYAAHMIRMGDFHEWPWLIQWVEQSSEYEVRWGDPVAMGGLLEELLNYYSNVQNDAFKEEDWQLDLLMPVKSRK